MVFYHKRGKQMNEEGKFYAVVWTLAAIVIVVTLICCTVKGLHNNTTLLEMVKAGANPLEAKCAVKGSGNGGDDCNILMSKK